MKQIFTLLLIIICIANTLQAQRISKLRPVNEKGERNGQWTLFYDADHSLVLDSTRAKIYRIINYENDQPIGITLEYYTNNTPRWEGRIIRDKPLESLDGVCTWYDYFGNKQVEKKYNNGEFKSSEYYHFSNGARVKLSNSWEDDITLLAEKYRAHNFKEALEALEKYINPMEFSYGPQHMYVFWSVLAICYLETDQYESYERVKGYIQWRYDSDLNEGVLNNVGLHALEFKNFDKAEEYLKRSLAQIELSLNDNPDYKTYTQVLDNLGVLFLEQKEYDKAEGYITRAHNLKQIWFYQDSIKISRSLNLLGEVQIKLGRKVTGLKNLQNGLSIDRALFRKGKIERYDNSLNDLATFYADELHFNKALELYEEEIQTTPNGVKRISDQITTLTNIAYTYSKLSRFVEAEQYYKQIELMIISNYGKTSFKYSDWLHQYAKLKHSMEDLDEAERFYKSTLNLKASLKGENNLDYATVLNNYGRCLTKQNKFWEAQNALSLSLNIRVGLSGVGDSEIYTGIQNLGGLYMEMKMYEEATVLFYSLAVAQDKVIGWANPEYFTTLQNLAGALWNSSQYQLAKIAYEESTGIAYLLFGPNSGEYLHSCLAIATLNLEQKEYFSAEKMLHRLIEKAEVNTNTTFQIRGLERLSSLYQSTGREQDYQKVVDLIDSLK